MYVRSWMSTPAVVLLADTPLLDALRFMEGRQVPQISVIGAEGLAGVVSRGDIHRVLGTGGPFETSRKTLGNIVVGPPMTVSPDLPIERVSEMMLLNHASSFPVVGEGRLLGMISSSDILRAFSYVMGACEGGARVYHSSSGTGDLLDEIRLRSRGLMIRSLVVCPSPGGKELVMRVRGRTAASVA